MVTRFLLWLIGRATPPPAREWVLGDTLEELDHVERTGGPAAARRWLRAEAWRVAVHAPRHRAASRRAPSLQPPAKGDGTVSGLARDVRYAFRVLVHAPGFTAVALLTLALGIGANTAMFAVVNAVLLKRLPFTDPDALMLVHLSLSQQQAARMGGTQMVWSYPKYRTFADLQHVYGDLALFAARDFDLSGDGDPLRLRGEVVTDRYPAILGITPASGRAFTYEEANREGAGAVAMIGHGLWTSRFGADPAIIGRSLRVNAVSFTIVGVLPDGFRGLNGDAQIWLPLAALEPSQITPDARNSHSYRLIGRRKPGVSEQEAVAAAAVLGEQVYEAYRQADSTDRWGVSALSLYASRVDSDVRRASLVLLGAVGFVLLIACVNLTNLALARAAARRREVAVRVAIGASRGVIARQLLAEGALLAFGGGVAGLMVGVALLGAARALLPDAEVFFRTAVAPGTPRMAGAAGLTRIGASMIGLDAATLLFTAAVSMLTALLVSFAPALQASSFKPIDALKSAAGSGKDAGGRRFGVRAVLVTTQIALALMLLTGAGLMVKSAAQLQATSTGVRSDHVLTARIDLPRASYNAERAGVFWSQLTERLAGLPGVEAVGIGNCPPVSGGCNGTSLWMPSAGRSPTGGDPSVGVHWADPGYFSVTGIQLLEGRLFTAQDGANQPKVVVINEAARRALWPNESPLGKRIAVGQGGFHVGAEIVGVVSNVRFRTIEAAPEPDVFLPAAQSYQPRMRLFIRSGVAPAGLVEAVSREIRGLDPQLPLSEIKTMEARIGDAMWRTRVAAWLLSSFAALALLLTGVGIFGVMAQTVAQRTPEIGIRMALGAQPRDVLRLVLGHAAVLTALGIAAGTGAALALTRLVAALLYGVQPNDPATFAAVAFVLAVVALVACYLPARRATRVDAVVALRAE